MKTLDLKAMKIESCRQCPFSIYRLSDLRDFNGAPQVEIICRYTDNFARLDIDESPSTFMFENCPLPEGG